MSEAPGRPAGETSCDNGMIRVGFERVRTNLEYQHRDYVSRQKKAFAGRFVTWAAMCVMAFQGARGGGKPV